MPFLVIPTQYWGVFFNFFNMIRSNNQQIVEDIFQLFEKYGHDQYFGEPVTQLQHACQAAEFAYAEGYDDEVIIAALLHDIGHLCVEANEHNAMADLGIKDHELEGANYLRQRGFSERICKLVGAHVAAKRYLTATSDSYYNNLSEASKKTLEFQGGFMSASEVQAFQDDPHFVLYIRMRIWDEMAKNPDTPLPDLSFYKDLIHSYLMNRSVFTL
jgi:2-amino-1-hydroxyethylphosphonate dioxygenase (glycine-forming)